MADESGISWTDSTFNPWMGCTKVGPACDHCYAERDMDKRLGRVMWGAGMPRVRTSIQNRNLPLRWNRSQFGQCPRCGWRGEYKTPAQGIAGCPDCTEGPGELSVMIEPTRRRVFSLSLGDWLDNEVPIEWLVDFLDVVRRTPNLDWLLLTKRIGNWRARLKQADEYCHERPGALRHGWILNWLDGNPPPNVWIGATVVNQEEADRDIPKLLRVPAAVRFLSIEPMLAAIDVQWALWKDCRGLGEKPLDWIICGGESGPHARPMHPHWVRSLRDQAKAAGVAFHFKQWGEWAPRDQVPANIVAGGRVYSAGYEAVHFGKKAAGRVLDGRTWDEFPNSGT